MGFPAVTAAPGPVNRPAATGRPAIMAPLRGDQAGVAFPTFSRGVERTNRCRRS
ncbi:hypothetical protein SABIM44S_01999 [Streptomyces abikoensis]